MRLRPRLALTVVGVAVPLVGAVFFARSRLEHQTSVGGLERLVISRMFDGGREDCERYPETWPRRPERPPELRRPPLPGREPLPRRDRPRGATPQARGVPPIELFAYRADLTSVNPDAPALPASMVAALEAGAHRATTGSIHDPGGLHMALRMPWFDEDPDSSSAVVFARMGYSEAPSLAREFLYGALAVAVLMLVAILAAAGPLVERVRRLTSDVRRAAKDRYGSPVAVDGRDEVTELAEAFNAAGSELREHADALEARERSLREFVEGTTHDVMLPLTVLQGHLSSLQERTDGDDAALVADAIEEAHYMASLVRNLSTAAKLEAAGAPLRRDSVDLVALIERVAARHAPVARQKQVTLEPVLPGAAVVVHGDGTLLEQALSNLVHNAVRYVEQGGRVLVVLSSEGGCFSLRVLDDGPGIPEPQLERLTERRWRADAARSRYPDGSGLGLAIAREVALRHGLELTLRAAAELGGLEAELAGPCA